MEPVLTDTLKIKVKLRGLQRVTEGFIVRDSILLQPKRYTNLLKIVYYFGKISILFWEISKKKYIFLP